MFKQTLKYLIHGSAGGRGRTVILLYHRVLPEIKSDPFRGIITVRNFIKQVDFLATRYTIISLSDAISGRKNDKPQLVLTFDDGYRDNYEMAFPILKRKGLPAAFFPVTDHIGNDRVLWDCEIVKILYNHKKIRKIKINGEVVSRNNMQSRRFFILRVINKLRLLNKEAREKALVLLKEDTGCRVDYDFSNDKCMDWEQLKKMSSGGMEVGSHGLTHTSLANMPFEDAVREIIKSKEAIENNLGTACLHFAFPFGSRQDYNQNLIDCVKKAGFKSCLLNIHGYNSIRKDSFCFKRVIAGQGGLTVF